MASTRRATTRFRRNALAALAGLVPALVLACGGSDSTTGPNPEPDPTVESVTVTPSSITLDAPGDTAHVEAEARDESGDPIEGVTFEWSSSDPSVATVDDEGVVTAESEGETDVSATVEGVSGSAGVSIGQEPAPEPAVSSVSPSPLVEGGSATVSGSGFASDPAGNTVIVDGVAATVTSASETSLEITVPDYDCLPSRDVTLEVQTSGGSSDLTEALTPDETPVSLASGQQVRVENPGDFCFQFEEASDTERYLLGVQSLSAAVGGVTAVTVTSEAVGGDGAAATTPVSLAAGGTGGGTGGAALSSGLRDSHRDAERRLRTWERRNLGGAVAAARSTDPRFRTSPIIEDPGTVAVDDTVELRVPRLDSDDLCADFDSVGGVVMAEGQRGIFVADTTNPDNGFTSADYQNFSDQLDDDIAGRLVDYFGVPPELQDERVIVLVSGSVNQHSSALGFVFSGDLFPRETPDDSPSCASSDEAAIYYARAPDPTNELGGGVYETEDARSQTPFIMAHEITHIIQHGVRLNAGQEFMSPVLAEAQATLAEEVVGHEVTGNGPGNDYGFDVAFGSDADGVEWYSNAFVDLAGYFGAGESGSTVDDAPEGCGWWRGDASPCFARSLWYGVGWSFLRWASDHHDGGDGSAFNQNLILAEPAGVGEPPVQPVAEVLGVPLEELMGQWAASLYADGRVSGGDPELDFPSWDLRDIDQNLIPSARLTPLEEGFADWQAEGEVRASSAAYVAIEGAGRPATSVRVHGGDGGALPAEMQVWLVRLE